MSSTVRTDAPDNQRCADAVVGILVVVPRVAGDRPAVSPAHVVAGLPLLRRIVLAATAAGYAEILVRTDESSRTVLDGTTAAALEPGHRPAGPARVVILPANVVPQPSWLRALLETPLERDRLFVDASMTMIVESADPAFVLDAAAGCASVSALVGELRSKYADSPWPFEADGRLPIAAPADVPRAETWLLRHLIKQREGFMSRHFERRISLALTRQLVKTSVTPNVMTVTSVVIGLVSAPFFLSAEPLWQVVGALILLTHSILDGCDGEIARLKFLQSRRGAVLDYWGDNVVHVAVFGCLGIGWSHAAGSVWPLIAGAIAVAATLGSAVTMFRRTADDRTTASESSSARLLDALASRDFIYLLLALAAFGKAAWFILAVAIGAPTYLALVLVLDRPHGRVR